MNPSHNKIFMLRQNIWFFTAFSIFLLVVGSLVFSNEHGDAIYFFSDRRTDFGNLFFYYFTKMGEELLYVVVLILLLFVRYRYALLVPLLGLGVTIISLSTKLFFSQPRPFLYYKMRGLQDSLTYIEGLTLNGGHTSFPSGHTMSAFALYTFLALCWPHKKWTGLLFFMIALMVGLSRVYLVQHFLCDVYLGAIIGVLIAMGLYAFRAFITGKIGAWGNRQLVWDEGKLMVKQ